VGNYLALERNGSVPTHKQALNAMAFLTKKVFGIEDFTIDKPTNGHTCRRPPVVLSRREVAAVFAHLDDPWKLAAQLMYDSPLRVIYLHVMKRPGAGGPSPLELA
jgi:hypothetical protein